MLNRNEAIERINTLSNAGVPFVFFTDFQGENAWVCSIAEAREEDVDVAIGGFSLRPYQDETGRNSFTFLKAPISFEDFQSAFNRVVREIRIGNSFLVNLTFKTPIQTDLTLQGIFQRSRAPYKVRFGDRFVVFSPETFVQVSEGVVRSFPMKGTIDATVPHAGETILNDPKEMAEHVTIVDLIRNDLSQVSDAVEVSRFRFISEVKTHEKVLLQVSSEITGKVRESYANDLGGLIFRLLPAGSICGAPKPKTVAIIRDNESYERGFYTGVCGYFDGKDLDTGVMIRYIEQEDGQYFYKSGGGITSFSDAKKEYQEIIDKIYVPLY